MKKNIFKFLLSAVCWVVVLPQTTFADTRTVTAPVTAVCPCENFKEFSKTINRDFSTTSNGITALYNRYGKINVKTWNENRVKIDIKVVVNADSDRDANRMMDKIQVNFTNTPGYVKAETMVGDIGTNWWDMSSWGGTSCRDFKIDYEIWMPVSNMLDLQNKFGHSFVGNLNGKLLADIKHGDLRVEKVNNDVDLNIQYGNATLTSVYNLTGTVGNGGLTVDEVRDVVLNSEYSSCTFRQAGNIKIVSKNDNLSFGIVDEMRMNTKYSNAVLTSAKNAFVTAQFTDFKMTNVSTQLDADLSYGQFKIESLGKNVSKVNIVSNFTDIFVGLERGAVCKLDITGNNANTKIPPGSNVERTISGGQTTVEGSTGEGSARSVIKAKLNYGSIAIR